MTCKCCGMDQCLNPGQQIDTTTKLSGVNGRGELTISALDQIETNFRSSMIEDTSRNALIQSVKRFPNFYESLSSFNTDFLKRDIAQTYINAGDNEVLEYRLNRGPITPLEYAEYLREFNHTPTSIENLYNTKPAQIVSELNYYYTGSSSNSILGKFCALMPNVFAAIDAFFDLLDDIDGLVQDAFAFLAKIRNVEDEIKAFFEKIKVKALIEAIKEKVEKAFQKIVKRVENAIKNFSVENVMGQIETFVNDKIVKRITQLKEEILEFFSEENIKNLGKKLKAQIDYAMSVFENPSIEEVQLLIAKICGLITGIEGVINKLKDPLNDFSKRYEEVFYTLKNVSDRVKGEAIRAGAIRLDDEVRKERINNSRERFEQQGNVPPPTTQEYEGVPTWEEIKDNNHPKIGIQGGWIAALGSAGWTQTDRKVKAMLMALQAKAGRRLIVNSCWRSMQYQKMLYDAGKTNTLNSLHTKGMAFDIKWAGWNRETTPVSDEAYDFMDLAKEVGFRGFGRYKGFIHIDYGPTRLWKSEQFRELERQQLGITST